MSWPSRSPDRIRRSLLAIIALVPLVVLNSERAVTTAHAQAEAMPQKAIQDFQLASLQQGWLEFDLRLFSTEDGGQSWTDITPWDAQDLTVSSFFLLDSQHGWAALTRSGMLLSDLT